MTDKTPFMAPPFDTGDSVAVLRCRESFSLDPAPLTALFAGQETKVAEATVYRALEEIAARLDRLQLARTLGEHGQIPGHARRISAIAGGLGLSDVQMVASHVANAAEFRSGVALGATAARLERCFDIAVSAVWDFRQYS